MVTKRPKPSRLQADLARRILAFLKKENAQPGHHLVEMDLCATFDVSRTPVRGALQLLEAEGFVTSRSGRGFVLAKIPGTIDDDTHGEEDDRRLFEALARARNAGKLPDQFTQQEIVRRFDARLGTVMAVLRQLAELGVVERKPGNGWAFAGDAPRILNESYAFRRALEPQILLQPGFQAGSRLGGKSPQPAPEAAQEKLARRRWRGVSRHQCGFP